MTLSTIIVLISASAASTIPPQTQEFCLRSMSRRRLVASELTGKLFEKWLNTNRASLMDAANNGNFISKLSGEGVEHAGDICRKTLHVIMQDRSITVEEQALVAEMKKFFKTGEELTKDTNELLNDILELKGDYEGQYDDSPQMYNSITRANVQWKQIQTAVEDQEAKVAQKAEEAAKKEAEAAAEEAAAEAAKEAADTSAITGVKPAQDDATVRGVKTVKDTETTVETDTVNGVKTVKDLETSVETDVTKLGGDAADGTTVGDAISTVDTSDMTPEELRAMIDAMIRGSGLNDQLSITDLGSTMNTDEITEAATAAVESEPLSGGVIAGICVWVVGSYIVEACMNWMWNDIAETHWTWRLFLFVVAPLWIPFMALGGAVYACLKGA